MRMIVPVLLISIVLSGYVSSMHCVSKNFYEGGTFKVGYGETGTCTYNFKSRYSGVMKISWVSFTVPGNMPTCMDKDFVKVYIGCIKPTFLTAFCSSNMNVNPHDIYSKDGCIRLVVKSSGNSNFRLKYDEESRLPDIQRHCQADSTLFTESGVISSPGWPDYYQRSSFWSGSCKWEIWATSTKVVKLNFMDVDIYSYGGSCSSFEYLKVRGEKSQKTIYTEEKTFCQRKPFSWTTKYYRLKIEMSIRTSRYHYMNRGFLVGYVAYDSEEEVNKMLNSTKWGIIGGAIAFLLIVGGAAFFVFWKCKNKRTQGTVATHNVGYRTTGQQGPGAGNYPVQQDFPLQGQHAAYTQQQRYPRQPVHYVPQGDPPHHEAYTTQPPPPYPGLPTKGKTEQPANLYTPPQPAIAPNPFQSVQTPYHILQDISGHYPTQQSTTAAPYPSPQVL